MKKFLVGLGSAMLLLVVALIPALKVNAAEPVTTEEELIAAVANGGDIVLGSDIQITKPIELFLDTTITSEGNNNYTIDGTSMVMAGKNGSILAAHAKLTLTNVTLTNALKYGVQAYDNGNVTLNGVTIKDCKWGAVLVNGGQVTINDLTMDSNAWGIEFAKGENVTGDPALVMNGTLKAVNQADAITVDDTQVEKFVVKNEENSANKIVLEDNKMLVKDASGKTVVESKVLANDLVVSIDGTEEVTKEPVETPEEPEEPEVTEPVVPTTTQAAEQNPNTSDSLPLYLIGILVGALGVGLSVKKLVK